MKSEDIAHLWPEGHENHSYVEALRESEILLEKSQIELKRSQLELERTQISCVAYWSELRSTWITSDASSFEDCLKALDYIMSEEIYICEV